MGTIEIKPDWSYVAKVIGIALDLGIEKDGKTLLKAECEKMARVADLTAAIHLRGTTLVNSLLAQDKVMNALNKETVSAIRELQFELGKVSV